MYANAHSVWKYDANLKVNAYDMEPVAKRVGKGRKKGAVVKALAISAVGSADGRTYEDCLQAISNALSSSTPKSYDSLPCTLSGLGT